MAFVAQHFVLAGRLGHVAALLELRYLLHQLAILLLHLLAQNPVFSKIDLVLLKSDTICKSGQTYTILLVSVCSIFLQNCEHAQNSCQRETEL
jgi:hypothetical protein